VVALSFAVIVEMVMMIATLLPAQSELVRRGEPQVARLHLLIKGGKPTTFGIPSDEDLGAAKVAIPGLNETN
jgi:hypothetical protein